MSIHLLLTALAALVLVSGLLGMVLAYAWSADRSRRLRAKNRSSRPNRQRKVRPQRPAVAGGVALTARASRVLNSEQALSYPRPVTPPVLIAGQGRAYARTTAWQPDATTVVIPPLKQRQRLSTSDRLNLANR